MTVMQLHVNTLPLLIVFYRAVITFEENYCTHLQLLLTTLAVCRLLLQRAVQVTQRQQRTFLDALQQQ
jgi:hypothetical protein